MTGKSSHSNLKANVNKIKTKHEKEEAFDKLSPRSKFLSQFRDIKSKLEEDEIAKKEK